MTRSIVTLLALCPMLGHAADSMPLVYLPFDQDAVIGIGRLDRTTVLPEVFGSQSTGVRGECLHIARDLRLPSAGNFDVEAGTVAFWMRATWRDSDIGHTLFCVYGGEGQAWLHNRWSIWANGTRISASLYPKTEDKPITVDTDVTVGDGQWHHIAWTWRGINSGRDDAELILYLDGTPAARRAGLRIDIGDIGPQIDIGRDSDASPDYADAEFDEFYLYPIALSADAVHRAAHGVQNAERSKEVESRPRVHSSWPDANRTYRFGITVDLPSGPAGPVTARVPLGLEHDLAQLNIAGIPRRSSLVVRDANRGTFVPYVMEDCDLLLSLTADGAAQTRHFIAAVGLNQYDFRVPLAARRRTAPPTPSSHTAFAFADYAQAVYGDAWDFDEGDDEDIDQWGNKPTFVRNRRVEDGSLKMTVSKDPWFAWGDLWGHLGTRIKRPVAIDLEQFNLLEMRVKQSCSIAEWAVFGLPIGGTLKQYKFPLKGSDWQTVRIDLREEARFLGTLSALRIDPTSDLEDVDVEIDWIRITRTVAAQRQAIQVAPANAVSPARMIIAPGPTQVPAGSERVVTIRAVDVAGQPVARWPLHLLVSGANATLGSAPSAPSLLISSTQRRAITDDSGMASVMVRHNPRAGTATTRLTVTPEFAETGEVSVAWDTLEGPPHHYLVSPAHACVVRERELPLTVTVQLVDEHNNPLTEAGRRVSVKSVEGMTATPAETVTDRAGRAELRLAFDLSKRWVGLVQVVDEQGLAGQSAPISVALDTPLPFTYRILPNGYFATSDGKPFVPLGGFYANWVQSETPNGEWDQCSPFHATTDAEKRLWLSKLAENGVTALRFMLRTHRQEPGMEGTEGLDAGGRVNRRLFSEILRYMDLAREFNIVFLAVVHDDYYKPIYYDRNNFSKFTRPAFAGVDLDALPPYQRRFVQDGKLLPDAALKYTDRDAVACQDKYATELTGFLKNCPAVFAYELENEMVDCPSQWANHAIAVLRDGDPARPVCVSHGGGGMMTADPLWWHRKTDIDFYTYHLYPHSNACTTPEMDYGLATDILTRYGRTSGVSFFGESSGDQFRYDTDPERRRWVMRDLIWISLTNGNPGCFFWNARLSEVAEFSAARDAMSRLDLTTFRRAKPPMAIVVSHPLDDDKYYRSEKGRADYEMMGRYCRHFQQLGVDFDFALDADGYAQSADLTAFAPPVPVQRRLSTPPGLATTYLTRNDWSEALIYVRNLAGIEPVELKHGRGMSLQHLRTRQPLDWQLQLDLPNGTYALHIYNLDTGEIADTEIPNDGTITLGKTDHDMAIVMKRH